MKRIFYLIACMIFAAGCGDSPKQLKTADTPERYADGGSRFYIVKVINDSTGFAVDDTGDNEPACVVMTSGLLYDGKPVLGGAHGEWRLIGTWRGVRKTYPVIEFHEFDSAELIRYTEADGPTYIKTEAEGYTAPANNHPKQDRKDGSAVLSLFRTAVYFPSIFAETISKQYRNDIFFAFFPDFFRFFRIFSIRVRYKKPERRPFSSSLSRFRTRTLVGHRLPPKTSQDRFICLVRARACARQGFRPDRRCEPVGCAEPRRPYIRECARGDAGGYGGDTGGARRP